MIIGRVFEREKGKREGEGVRAWGRFWGTGEEGEARMRERESESESESERARERERERERECVCVCVCDCLHSLVSNHTFSGDHGPYNRCACSLRLSDLLSLLSLIYTWGNAQQLG